MECDTEPVHGIHEGVSYTLGLWDLSMQGEDYDRLRPLSYPETDVFLVCLNVVAPDILHKIKDYWVPEITQHCPKVPFLLVGTQTDLRNDQETVDKLTKNGEKPVSFEKGMDLAREVGAEKYVECSALANMGVDEVIEEAVKVALAKPEARQKKICNLI